MYQYDDPTAVATRPAASAVGTPGWFSDGDPAIGQMATILRAEFMNMLMAELLSVIDAADIAPSKASSSQLLAAMNAMYAGKTSGLLGNGFTVIDATSTLDPTVVGGTVQICNNTGPVNITIPLSSAVGARSRIEIVNSSVYDATIIPQGADTLANINAQLTAGIVLKPGDSLTILRQGLGIWLAIAGSAELAFSGRFSSSLSGSGYQKLPSGLIVQWGVTSVVVAANTETATSWTFPITFQNACLQVFPISGNYVGSSCTAENFTTTSCNGYVKHSAAVTLTTRWLAIGY